MKELSGRKVIKIYLKISLKALVMLNISFTFGGKKVILNRINSLHCCLVRYREPKYLQSKVENGKRVFKTKGENSDSVHKVTKVGDKPNHDN